MRQRRRHKLVQKALKQGDPPYYEKGGGDVKDEHQVVDLQAQRRMPERPPPVRAKEGWF